MYELRKEFTFEAAHRLPGHDGKCKNLHGHSWRGAVILKGGVLHRGGPQNGMLMDFGRLKALLAPILLVLDHSNLNDLMDTPTSENVSKWLFTRLYDAMFEQDSTLCDLLAGVVIEETSTSSCTYWRGPV